jgi:threonyl-tRNA synthetase
MVHHAVFGSIGRFIAILLEHYGGALPFWLAPEQVAVGPISRDQADYAVDVREAFEVQNIRAVVLDGAETLSRRIVAACKVSIPVVAVVGRRKAEQKTVSLRERDGDVAVLALQDATTLLWQRAYPAQNGGT